MGVRDRKPMVAEDDPGFVRFWNLYEKRRSKKDARIAWAQVNPSPELVDRMCEALAWQFKQRDWLKDDCQYAPLPATYLRNERWTDERPKTTPPPALSAAVSDPIGAWLGGKAMGS